MSKWHIFYLLVAICFEDSICIKLLSFTKILLPFKKNKIKSICILEKTFSSTFISGIYFTFPKPVK